MTHRGWLIVGLAAQLLFFGRFVVQWLTSERRGKSTVPPAFWYFSLAGGLLLLAYSIERRDPVFIVGQALGLVVYVRNLMLLGRRARLGMERAAPWLALGLLTCVLAFGFLGTRGLWDPDEGRYAESSREMLASGDWMTPTLGGKPHWTKPPVTYWTIAGSMSAFGTSEAAVRWPTALAFALTVFVVAALGVAMFGRRTGWLAGVVYATCLLPFAAANIVTPDTLLALFEALALYAFWRGFTAETPLARRIWPAVTGAVFGLAMLTKGPPGLLFLPAMYLFRALPAGRRPGAAPVLSLAGVALFAVFGLTWYALSAATHPGLLGYFLHDEVVGRLAGAHHRNAGPFGWFVVYAPALLAGALPWCFAWPSMVARWRTSLGDTPVRAAIVHRPRVAFLTLTFVVPLVVFVVARSRLPLYVLPLFVPLSLATTAGLAQLVAAGEGTWYRSRWARAIPAWAAVLLAARFVFAQWPSTQDARRLYHSLPMARGAELVLDDSTSHYGLAFYYAREGGPTAEIEYARRPGESPTPGTVSLLDEVREETQPECHAHLFVVENGQRVDLDRLLVAEGAPIRETAEYPGGFAVLTSEKTDPPQH